MESNLLEQVTVGILICYTRFPLHTLRVQKSPCCFRPVMTWEGRSVTNFFREMLCAWIVSIIGNHPYGQPSESCEIVHSFHSCQIFLIHFENQGPDLKKHHHRLLRLLPTFTVFSFVWQNLSLSMFLSSVSKRNILKISKSPRVT